MGSENGRETSFYSHKDLTSDYYQVLVEKGRPRWCKFLWVVVTVFFLVGTGLMVYNLLQSYLQYSSYNTESISWTSSVALPAITICNTNYLNYTDFKASVNSDDETGVSFLNFLFQYMSEYNGTGGIENWLPKEYVTYFDSSIKSKWNTTLDMFNDFVFYPEQYLVGDGQYHEMFKFAGKWKTLNYTTNVGAHKYGSCILLNDDESMVQILGGYEGGLTIDLDAKIADYLPSTTTKGFKIYLRNPNETVLIDKGGILITPGTENFLSIKKTEVTRLEPIYGDCKNVSSEFVSTISKSVRECLQEDWFNVAVDYCNCMPWYLLNKLQELNLSTYTEYWYGLVQSSSENSTYNETCGFATQAMCDIQVLEYLTKYANETVCHEPCYFEEWDWGLTAATFPPSEEYYTNILYPSLKTYTDTNYTFSYATENFIRLHIYYDDIKVTAITQEKAYEIFNFIAELGGTVDLLIGFSFFTVFQLLEILVAYCVFKTCKRGQDEGDLRTDEDRKKKEKKPKDKKQKHVESIRPADGNMVTTLTGIFTS